MMDEKLIETVALAITDCEAAGPITLSAARVVARAVLAAVNASGTHWIAPLNATFDMSAAVDRETDGACSDATAREAYRIMRAFYLADTSRGELG